MGSNIRLKNLESAEFSLSHEDGDGAISITSKQLKNSSYTVATVATMEALTATDGQSCIVTDLDRGGIFVYDSSLVGSDNQGTNFSGWIRQYSGAVNVKWFGAVGYNSSFSTTWVDSSNEIQKAINYCISTYEAMFIDSSYRVTTELLVDNTIKIYGYGKTAIDTPNKGGRLIFDNSNSSDVCIRFKPSSTYGNYAIKLSGFGIYSLTESENYKTVTTNQHGIEFEDSYNFIMEDMEFVGQSGYSININSNSYGQNCTIKDTFFRRCGGCIGGSLNLVMTTGNIVNTSFENEVNPTSPQDYFFDLRGWRELKMSNIIVEGVSASASQKLLGIAASGYFTLDGLHEELNPSPTNHIVLEYSNDATLYGGTVTLSNIGRAKVHSEAIKTKVIIDKSIPYDGYLSNYYTTGGLSNTVYRIDNCLVLSTIYEFDNTIHNVSSISSFIQGGIIVNKSPDISLCISEIGVLYRNYVFGRKQGLSINEQHGLGSSREIVTDSRVGRAFKIQNTSNNTLLPNIEISYTLKDDDIGKPITLTCTMLIDTLDASFTTSILSQDSIRIYENKDNIVNELTTFSAVIFTDDKSSGEIITMKVDGSGVNPVYVLFTGASITKGGFSTSNVVSGSSELLTGSIWSSAPTTGDYLKGDRLKSVELNAGNSYEYLCTASGTPGTWLSLGTV